MITLNTSEPFDEAMRWAVEQRGRDFEYPFGSFGWVLTSDDEFNPGCRYVHEFEEKPACIIGMALHRLGVPLSELRKVEVKTAGSALDALVNWTGNPRNYLLLRVKARDAQIKQDWGGTWGEALEAYFQ